MPKCVYIIAPTANFTLLLSPSARTLIFDAVVEPVETTSGGNCQLDSVVEPVETTSGGNCQLDSVVELVETTMGNVFPISYQYH
jgi:hypothetical protein